MRVGLIVPSFSTDERYSIPALAALAASLSAQADLTVFPLRNPAGPERATGFGATIIDAGGPGMRLRQLLPNVLRAIRQEHRRKPFHLLHAYWLFEPGLVALAAGRMLRLPVVTSIGGAELAALPGISYGGMRSRRGRRLHTMILRASTLVTGGSEYVLDLARSIAPSATNALRIAPLPVSFRPEYPATRVASEPARLLQVGAYLPVKGQDIAIRAMHSIRQACPDAEMTFIGENPTGYRERMAALAKHLGLDQAVTLRERIPHDELADWYAAADLLLMPSRHESQGMVVLEAGTFGLPTLGSNVGVVRDLAPTAAATVPPDDIEALTRAAIRLLHDRATRRSLGEAAREQVEARYSSVPIARTWLAVYHEARELGGK